MWRFLPPRAGRRSRHRLLRAAAACALVLLVAGCANGLAARQVQLQRLVGQKLAVLIAAEGVPDRSLQQDDVTYLSYVRQYVDMVPPLPLGGPPWFWGYYAAAPPAPVLRFCETTFAVKDGVVQSYLLRGNDCG